MPTPLASFSELDYAYKDFPIQILRRMTKASPVTLEIIYSEDRIIRVHYKGVAVLEVNQRVRRVVIITGDLPREAIAIMNTILLALECDKIIFCDCRGNWWSITSSTQSHTDS